MRTTLQLFIKYPHEGQVKSRLSGLLGERGAAQLHCELAERQLAELDRLPSRFACELWCNEDADAPWYAQLFERWPRLRYRRQVAGSLGERMRRALCRAMPGSTGVLQIGCDCPELSAERIRQAARALHHGRDAALIAAEDGGYVLAGYTAYRPGLFCDIDWGSSRVLEQKLRRFQREGLLPVVYSPLWDVDRPEDYRRYLKLRQSRGAEDAG